MTGGPLFVSSGDLIADRRYKWALDHAARGDLAGAADILAQTVELAPAFATAWFALGAIRDNLGDRAGAIAAWEKARDADPEDYHGARLQLARLAAGEVTQAMTEVYVRRLFDQHAETFDQSLLERLDYRGPAVLLAAVEAVAGRPLRIGSMLDLGCGTGLAGAAFRPYVDWLTGVDLSPQMVAKARAKGLYDRLAAAELRQFLAAEADDRARYHLIVAADVFVYVSDLAPVAAAAARVLAPGGRVAFTVETHAGEVSCCSRPCATPTAWRMCALRLPAPALPPFTSPRPRPAPRRACRWPASSWWRAPRPRQLRPLILAAESGRKR
jgi:predicted TPR repeat methyltransferase